MPCFLIMPATLNDMSPAANLPTGVMDAVQKGYLKNMYFGIAQDAEATNLLEVGCTVL